MHEWNDGFIAVDWGTTNRRAYRIDPAGAVVAEMEDESGVTAIAPEGFPVALGQIVHRLGDLPLLMAGMIGSNRGWREAPYVRCPASVADLARNLLWIEPGRVAIVPGVAWSGPDRADVMRGEEVQVFGHLAQAGADEAWLCHPGTHTKWIKVADGAIKQFRTLMTGELFALLRDHSILAPLLHADVEPGADFLAGVERGLEGADLAAELFSVRAGVLLGQRDAATAAGWVSGLLVGADVRGGLASWGVGRPRCVTVLGRPTLNRLYCAALAHAGVLAVGADGGPAFVAGMQSIRKALS
jgi:2-dehydro-3-deoxygalactonokinase